MNIVLHPYFKDEILSGNKRACMVQEKFLPNLKVTFSTSDGLREVPFATAVIKEAAQLLIYPKKGFIFRRIQVSAVDQWIKLNAENTKRVILVEGFAHPDDFWNNLQTRKPFEVNQFFFEEVTQL